MDIYIPGLKFCQKGGKPPAKLKNKDYKWCIVELSQHTAPLFPVHSSFGGVRAVGAVWEVSGVIQRWFLES